MVVPGKEVGNTQHLPPHLGHLRRMSKQTPSFWEEQRGFPATHTGQGSCESSVPLESPVQEQGFDTRAASPMAGMCKDDSEEVTDFMCRPGCPSFASQHLVTTLQCFHHHCHVLCMQQVFLPLPSPSEIILFQTLDLSSPHCRDSEWGTQISKAIYLLV